MPLLHGIPELFVVSPCPCCRASLNNYRYLCSKALLPQCPCFMATLSYSCAPVLMLHGIHELSSYTTVVQLFQGDPELFLVSQCPCFMTPLSILCFPVPLVHSIPELFPVPQCPRLWASVNVSCSVNMTAGWQISATPHTMGGNGTFSEYLFLILVAFSYLNIHIYVQQDIFIGGHIFAVFTCYLLASRWVDVVLTLSDPCDGAFTPFPDV